LATLPFASTTSNDAFNTPGGTPSLRRSTVHDHVPAVVAVLALQPPNEPPGHVTVKATPVTFPPVVVAAKAVW
jgi:hypothetical protein